MEISVSPLYDFTGFVHRWLSLLATGRLEEAAKLIDGSNNYGIQWGVDNIQKALQDYARSDASPCVTDPEAMPGDGRPKLLELNDGSGL